MPCHQVCGMQCSLFLDKTISMKMNENGLFHSLNFIYSRIFSEKKDALTHIESLSTAEKQRRNSTKREEENQRERGSGGGGAEERQKLHLFHF